MSGHRTQQPVEPLARRAAGKARAGAVPSPVPPPPSAATAGATRWWSVALVAATVLAYLPALWAGYIWDDDDYLTENRLVQAADGLPRLWEIRRDPAGHFRPNTPQYYPLVFTTYWLEHRLWGLHPAGYHVVNVLLHAASALLLWRIGARLRIPAAGLIAAVFALHPLHVESVAWVTERKNVLSGVFFFLALLAFLNFADGRGWRWYAATLGLFTAALLSKTVTAMLAPVLVIVSVRGDCCAPPCWLTPKASRLGCGWQRLLRSPKRLLATLARCFVRTRSISRRWRACAGRTAVRRPRPLLQQARTCRQSRCCGRCLPSIGYPGRAS